MTAAAKAKNPAADASRFALEQEIDQLVYQLYGLKEEEIDIVKGKKFRRTLLDKSAIYVRPQCSLTYFHLPSSTDSTHNPSLHQPA